MNNLLTEAIELVKIGLTKQEVINLTKQYNSKLRSEEFDKDKTYFKGITITSCGNRVTNRNVGKTSDSK